MSLRYLLLAALALPAAPAMAQSLSDTHVEIAMPGSKFPARLYRPIRTNECRPTYRHHQSGKMTFHGTAEASERCAARFAARDAARPN